MKTTKMLNSFDLNDTSDKIKSNDSERLFDPALTTNLAIEKLKSINCEYNVEYFNIDNIFYSSEFTFLNMFDMDLAIQPAGPVNAGGTSMGKGTTPEQCTASMYMETIERISLWQHMNSFYPVYHGINLRTGNVEKIAIDTTSSEMVAAGNTYEEATLHGLHEMIENESIGLNGLTHGGGDLTANLQPYRVIDIKKMFPDWPDWVDSSFTVLQIPTLIPEFYNFIGLRYPIEPRYAHDWGYILGDDGVWGKQTIKYSEWRGDKTAYAFTAAGINPRKAISRCIQENFQGPDRYKYFGKKRPVPDWLEVVDGTDLVNHETSTVTGDIKFIMSKVPERFNVWAVDLTSPELGVPVVKIVTDYHMPANMGQKGLMNLFYDTEK